MLKFTEIVKNLSPSIDGEILSAKRRMCLAPNNVRHCLLTKVADQLALARQKPNFAEYCSISRETHTDELMSMLEPLVNSTGNNGLREALMDIVLDAQKIGIDLFSCPYDTRFHFPELHESYDPTVMVNLDPALAVNIVRAGVSLSITPYIRLGLTMSLCVIRMSAMRESSLGFLAKKRVRIALPDAPHDVLGFSDLLSVHYVDIPFLLSEINGFVVLSRFLVGFSEEVFRGVVLQGFEGWGGCFREEKNGFFDLHSKFMLWHVPIDQDQKQI
ncbi:hypothetical protein TSTA_095150 [Talaromyces stipitatus ATCC 10500]|uniref:Uncharacterized protein n=1 Tax=Talaromyces stipitatus (strain ATCC 10500 / CBS 375.48 / QM 6759 / NRRL 1006) TaxID=441959 RepID=B8M397_TALSN|nr:uncharacterized protein TSTA_095150 [Talaromyces stipitatus ATCC 10500]EED22269.1 hypothetical protein TSTA_095150 [Talaromyces stipitatus ATCC 10500]